MTKLELAVSWVPCHYETFMAVYVLGCEPSEFCWDLQLQSIVLLLLPQIYITVLVCCFSPFETWLVVLLFYIHGFMVASANVTLFHFRLVFLLKTKSWLIHIWEENHGRLESFPWVFACRCGLNILVFVVERLVNMLCACFFFGGGFLIWTLNEWLTESLKPLVSVCWIFFLLSDGPNNRSSCWFNLQGYLDGNSKGRRKIFWWAEM